MQIIINPAEDIELSEALEAHVHRSLDKVEQRFGDWLTRAEVFVKDVNGPKHGVDKHTRLEARPRGTDPIVVEHQDEDAYLCVSRAAGKLERVLERRRGQLHAREKY